MSRSLQLLSAHLFLFFIFFFSVGGTSGSGCVAVLERFLALLQSFLRSICSNTWTVFSQSGSGEAWFTVIICKHVLDLKHRTRVRTRSESLKFSGVFPKNIKCIDCWKERKWKKYEHEEGRKHVRTEGLIWRSSGVLDLCSLARGRLRVQTFHLPPLLDLCSLRTSSALLNRASGKFFFFNLEFIMLHLIITIFNQVQWSELVLHQGKM